MFYIYKKGKKMLFSSPLPPNKIKDDYDSVEVVKQTEKDEPREVVEKLLKSGFKKKKGYVFVRC